MEHTFTMKSFRSTLRLLAAGIGLMTAASASVHAASPTNNTSPLWPWAVYYSDKAPLSAFAPFKLLVLDSEFHPPLAPLLEQKKVLLGYVSLGEVEKHRAWFGKAQAAGLTLKENQNWPGSFFVDMRNPAWNDIVLNDIIPQIQAKGFNGLFFDTLDNPDHLEQENPKLYAGMRGAAVELIAAIRAKYPNLLLMMNRGYGLLPGAASKIDMILAESFYADYDFAAKKNRLVKAEDYQWQVEMLERAKIENPNIGIYTLDYWNPGDKEKIQHIYALHQQSGFSPYVSTVELNEIFAPPAP
jgi:polysaccharide biosynthesis protein PelA